jgi:hypothetical protein
VAKDLLDVAVKANDDDVIRHSLQIALDVD